MDGMAVVWIVAGVLALLQQEQARATAVQVAPLDEDDGYTDPSRSPHAASWGSKPRSQLGRRR
jgi:hypothetical protein